MRRFFLAIILTNALFINAPLPILAKQPDFSELEKTALAELKERNVAGVAVAIVSGDKIIFAKGFGVSNAETNAPVTTDMLFQIGSITKTFTAAAILTFAEEGKLKLDAPIGSYAKGLSPGLSQITLQQLLSHTGGLKDEPDEFGTNDESEMAIYIRSWKDDYVLFDSGQIFSYSNSGFALAGFTMQEANNKPYADLMSERILQPLGMTRTTFRPTIAMTYPLSMGHKAKPNEKPTVVRPMANDTRLWPAGTMYSSVNEMARFAIAFLNGGKLEGKQVLSPNVIAQMSTPRAEQLSAKNKTEYGYGLFMDDFRGVHRLYHDGSMTGFVCMMAFVPEHHFAVIILGNGDGVALSKTQEKAMELMLPLTTKEEPKTKQPIEMTETEMQKYVGVYNQPNRWKIEIVMKENKLFIKEFGLELQMTKIGDNRFSFQLPRATSPEEIVFKTGKDGIPVAINQFVWAFKRIVP